MAKIADVLQIERNRQEATEWNKIHLFQMGDFYRAYEWSAWLIVVIAYNDEVRKQSKDRKPLKLSHKQLANSEDTFCFVGFPIKSMEKFIPTRTGFESTENKHIIVTITLPQPKDGTEIDYERLNKAFTEWKAAIPVSNKEDIIDENGNPRPPKPKTDKKTSVTITPQVATATVASGGIISQILGYQLQEHTDIDNRMFIASLQKQIAGIL